MQTAKSPSIPDSLPLDVLYEVLGHLVKLRDLVRCSHVCRRWRDVATHQYPYAQEVVTSSSQTEAQNDFLLRRLAASTLPLDWSLKLAVNHLRPYIPDDILSVLSDNLYRIRSLYISSDTCGAPAIMRALSRPAPALRRVSFIFGILHDQILDDFHPLNHRIHIPPDYELFGGHSPLLRFAHFAGLAPPVTRIPAFDAVEDMVVCHTFPWMEPGSLLATFPNVKRLQLHGDAFVDVSRFNSPPYPAIFEAVDLEEFPGQVALLSQLVSPRTAYIRARVTAPGMVELLMSHLPPGDLTCEICYSVYFPSVDVTFLHPGSGIRRRLVFRGLRRACDCDEFDADLFLRVTDLKVDARLFALAGVLFPSLPSIRVLTIVNGLPRVSYEGDDPSSDADDDPSFDSDDYYDDYESASARSDQWSPRGTTHVGCPALLKLVLAQQRGRGDKSLGGDGDVDVDVDVDADDLVTFMAQSLGHTAPETVELELQSVLLNGSTAPFSRMVVLQNMVAVPGPDKIFYDPYYHLLQ